MAHPVQKLIPQLVLSVADVQTVLGYSKRTFYELRADPAERFPAPFQMKGRDYWFVTDVLGWAESKRRTTSTPGGSALLREAA